MTNLKNSKAWALLLEDEKHALSLHFVSGKSTWEAGEIMGKSHYKYLEILARAKKFLEIFENHFNTFGELFPPEISINPITKKYFEGTMLHRNKVTDVIKSLKMPELRNFPEREKILRFEYDKWKTSKNLAEQSILNLILTFDRYNNFRILPKALQEPHAFKRRNKNDHKKLLGYWIDMKYSHFKELKKRCKAKETTPSKNIGYIFLIRDIKAYDYQIIPVDSKREKTMSLLNQVGICVFKEESMARNFCKVIIEYWSKDIHHCREGLKFWPLFRDFCKKAMNFEAIFNYLPNRKYDTLTFKDTDLVKVKPAKKYYNIE